MINTSDPKYKAYVQAIQAVAIYMQQVATDPLMSWDDKMKVLQWVYKKIPQMNRLIIELKTKEIEGPK